MANTIATMIDNNRFSFNMCNFGIRSDFKKKTQTFSNFVKRNTFSKFELMTLKVEKAFSMTSFFWKVIPVSFRKLVGQ